MGRGPGLRTADLRLASLLYVSTVTPIPTVWHGLGCPGPWGAQNPHMVGLELPITPYRRQVFVADPFDALPQPLPMAIDFRPHPYFRREGPGILSGTADLNEPPSFNSHMDWAFLERVFLSGTIRREASVI